MSIHYVLKAACKALCRRWAFWGPKPGHRVSSSMEARWMPSTVPKTESNVVASVLLTDLTVVKLSMSLACGSGLLFLHDGVGRLVLHGAVVVQDLAGFGVGSRPA